MQANLQQAQNNAASLSQQQQQTATIGTMQSLQAMQTGQMTPADWQHGRVQLVQQPMSNSAYIPQLYSPQVLMPGNLIHPGLGQQQIQLVASNCKFQGGQLTPQMLATAAAQGKQVIGGAPGNFSGTYTLPTIPSSQSQTLLFSPVGVISSQQQQQQNLMPQMQSTGSGQQPANNNNSNPGTPVKQDQEMQKGQKILQKVNNNQSPAGSNTGNNNNQQQQQCVQVPQAMSTTQIIQQPSAQFAPWMPGVQQFWTTNGLQQPFLQNQIIFRGAQQDGSQNMFIQHNPQQQTTTATAQPQMLQQNQTTITLPCNLPQQQAAQQQTLMNNNNTVVTSSGTGTNTSVSTPVNKGRVGVESIAPKQQPRAQSILPQQQQQGGPGQIRPALSVSTQTQQNQAVLKQSKLRAKPSPVRPQNPQVLKPQDPTKLGQAVVHQVGNQQMHQVVTSMGNK